MRRFVPGLILSLCAAAAQAGPWPRETGAVFLAAGGSYRFDLATAATTSETTIYAEYGAGPRLTLGFDGMQAAGGGGQALVFARMPLGAADRRLKLAVGVGLGGMRLAGAPDWSGLARVSVAVGAGHDIGRGGWWTVTAAVESDGTGQGALGKLDATFGLGVTETLQAVVQLETSGRSATGAQVTVVPGVIWRLGPQTRLHGGVELRADRTSRAAGLRLGLWRDF